jgi:signal transduction histidine kinase
MHPSFILAMRFPRELLICPTMTTWTLIRTPSSRSIIDGLSRLDDHENHTARLHPGMFSVRQMVRDTSADFQEFAGQRKITLEAVLGEDELLVQADGNKIAIALGNLVKNALTFTNENGQVRITARAVSGFVQVSVIDDGIGILPTPCRVFERYGGDPANPPLRWHGPGSPSPGT